jgi:hypothetical protein
LTGATDTNSARILDGLARAGDVQVTRLLSAEDPAPRSKPARKRAAFARHGLPEVDH